MDKVQIKTIGIVGAGKAGCQLFKLFATSPLTKVGFVADVNPGAPAMLAAKDKNIPTYTQVEAALANPVDFILELTGNSKVIDLIRQAIAHTDIQLITHEMAFILLMVIGENNRGIAGDIGEIKGEITGSLGGISALVDNIDEIASQMNILSINARIEAARVGQQGRGFAVVASEIGKAADEVKKVTRQIEQVNSAIVMTSEKIDRSKNRLIEM